MAPRAGPRLLPRESWRSLSGRVGLRAEFQSLEARVTQPWGSYFPPLGNGIVWQGGSAFDKVK